MNTRTVAEITIKFVNPHGLSLYSGEMAEFLSRVRVSNPYYTDLGRPEEFTVKREAYEEEWREDTETGEGYWQRVQPSLVLAEGEES